MPLLHGTEVAKSYVVASLPRTGSYLLCEALENTGLGGRPAEPLTVLNMPNFLKEWDMPADAPMIDYVARYVQYATGPNGVFGIKIHYGQIEWTRKMLDIGEPHDLTTLDYLFPDAKYINIVRKDVRAQAISVYRAYISGEWWKKQDVFQFHARNPDPPYNSKKIRAWETVQRNLQLAWDYYFASKGIKPLVVTYEDLDKDWRAETRRCLEYLGEDPTAVDHTAEPTLMKQADAVTRAWRRRLDEEDARNGAP